MARCGGLLDRSLLFDRHHHGKLAPVARGDGAQAAHWYRKVIDFMRAHAEHYCAFGVGWVGRAPLPTPVDRT